MGKKLLLAVLLTSMVAMAHGQVVRVSAPAHRGTSTGAGVYVGEIDGRGVTLTCRHIGVVDVVKDQPVIDIMHDKLGYDLLAVFTKPLDVPAIQIGETPSMGDMLTITGYPLGEPGRHDGPYSGTSGRSMVIGVASQGGDSGGAVTNDQGELVGLLWGTQKTSSKAVPCGAIRAFIGRVREKVASTGYG